MTTTIRFDLTGSDFDTLRVVARQRLRAFLGRDVAEDERVDLEFSPKVMNGDGPVLWQVDVTYTIPEER